MFLVRNGNGRTDVLYMLEHEDRIFLCVFEFLEEEKRFFVITQAPLDSITWNTRCN